MTHDEGKSLCAAALGSYHVGRVAEAFDHLPTLLGRRNWNLVEGTTSAPDFVTSDSPVTLVWTVPTPEHIGLPGLMHTHSEVGMALSRRTALIGTYGATEESYKADERMVAVINGRTAAFAVNYVYAPTDDLVMAYGDGPNLSSADWFDL